MLKTVKETLVKSGDTCFIAKKGKLYVTILNDELALTKSQMLATAFESPEHVERFLEVATIDTRNARVIGKSVTITDVTRP